MVINNRKENDSKLYSNTYQGFLSEHNKVLEFFNAIAEENNVDMVVMNKFNIIIDELFTNITTYGYENKGGEIGFTVLVSPSKLIIEFTDESIAFNPLERQDPDITLSAEERSIGGLGIFMVKKLSDNFEYQRIDNHNVLIVTKNL